MVVALTRTTAPPPGKTKHTPQNTPTLSLFFLGFFDESVYALFLETIVLEEKEDSEENELERTVESQKH